MAGNLEQFLERLLDRVEGLRTVVVSDRDGVPLIYVGQPLPSDGCLSSVFPMAADQAGKLNLGKCNSITTFFEDKLIVHVNHAPLTVSLVADSDANAGLLLALVKDIQTALEPLRSID